MIEPDRAVEDALRKGRSYKEVAFDTGLSASSIWRVQRRLAERLGCARRIQLIAALRGTSTLEVPDDCSLTRAERVVANLALRGEPTVAIARHRGVAVRTIVNQLASAFQKLGVRSRSELAAFAAVPKNGADTLSKVEAC